MSEAEVIFRGSYTVLKPVTFHIPQETTESLLLPGCVVFLKAQKKSDDS